MLRHLRLWEMNEAETIAVRKVEHTPMPSAEAERDGGRHTGMLHFLINAPCLIDRLTLRRNTSSESTRAATGQARGRPSNRSFRAIGSRGAVQRVATLACHCFMRANKRRVFCRLRAIDQVGVLVWIGLQIEQLHIADFG